MSHGREKGVGDQVVGVRAQNDGGAQDGYLHAGRRFLELLEHELGQELVVGVGYVPGRAKRSILQDGHGIVVMGPVDRMGAHVNQVLHSGLYARIPHPAQHGHVIFPDIGYLPPVGAPAAVERQVHQGGYAVIGEFLVYRSGNVESKGGDVVNGGGQRPGVESDQPVQSVKDLQVFQQLPADVAGSAGDCHHLSSGRHGPSGRGGVVRGPTDAKVYPKEAVRPSILPSHVWAIIRTFSLVLNEIRRSPNTSKPEDSIRSSTLE